jgi:hypothetical protein
MQARLVVAQKAVIDLTHKLVHLSDFGDDMGSSSNKTSRRTSHRSIKTKPSDGYVGAGDAFDYTADDAAVAAMQLPQLFAATAPGAMITYAVSDQLRLSADSGGSAPAGPGVSFSIPVSARSATSMTSGLSSVSGKPKRAYSESSKRPSTTTAVISSAKELARSTMGTSAKAQDCAVRGGGGLGVGGNDGIGTGGVLVVGEELQLRGKSQLLIKYVQLYDGCVRNHTINSRDDSTKDSCSLLTLRAFDFSATGMLDTEMKIVVDYIRNIETLAYTQTLNLSKNMLTGASAEVLALWLIALGDSEFERRTENEGIGVMDIDLRYNMVCIFSFQAQLLSVSCDDVLCSNVD